MTAFPNTSLAKLRNPQLLLQVARTVHEQALRLIANDEIPRHYIASEVYEPGVERLTEDGRKYYEISRYSDGFGSSLFILGEKMLFLSSNHENVASELSEVDRDLYLNPLLAGLPEEWSFVVELLQHEERFRDNPPTGVFWFQDGEWSITSLYEAILVAPKENVLSKYRCGFAHVDEVDLSSLFSHSNEDQVNQELIEAHFNEWRF